MNPAHRAEVDLLDATARSLSERGYEVVYEPTGAMLPASLKGLRPDAIAIGRAPKLVIEVTSERSENAQRVVELERLLRGEPDWQLHLVLNRASNDAALTTVSDAEIVPLLRRAKEVAVLDSRAALLMGWASLEGLSRSRQPEEFARPQSPGRIIERLASQGTVTATEATFLRTMAQKRNAFVHGDLMQSVKNVEIEQFLALLTNLVLSPALWFEARSSGEAASHD